MLTNGTKRAPTPGAGPCAPVDAVALPPSDGTASDGTRSGRPCDPAPGPVPSRSASAAGRLAPPLGALAAVAAAFGGVGAVDPNRSGHYPMCPVLALTGDYCPACGGLRGAYALVHGDLVGALHDNAAAVVGYAVCAVLWALWVGRRIRGRPGIGVRLGPAVRWGLGAALLAFAVARNLPFGAVLAP